MKILNIVAFYDNYEEVRSYISNLKAVSKGRVDLCIVVNKDTNKRMINLVDEYRDIRVFNFSRNVGYLNSMLMVINEISLRKYSYVVLSNTDIQYPDKEVFSKLLGRRYGEDIGCIAPCVYSIATGSFSNPHYSKRIPKGKIKRLILIFTFPVLALFYSRLSSLRAMYWKKTKKGSQYVYSPHGSYMIFTREFIERIKGYIYPTLMYSEESCVGELLICNGMRCYYDDQLNIEHLEGSVTSLLALKSKCRYIRESLEYIYSEFYQKANQ